MDVFGAKVLGAESFNRREELGVLLSHDGLEVAADGEGQTDSAAMLVLGIIGAIDE